MRIASKYFLALVLGLDGTLATAQTWPAKPVRVMTAFGAGSGSDQIAGIVAEEFQSAFKQPFVVDTKPGASGFIAVDTLRKAPADGYTLLLTPATVYA